VYNTPAKSKLTEFR